MNGMRIIGAGLVAGLVMNIGEFAIEPLMGPQMEKFFGRLGLPVPGEPAMLGLAVMVLALGITTVWLYAAVTPRFGAGIATAVIAGAVVWLLSCLLPNVVLLVFGVFDAKLFWFASLWPFVETIAAAIVGAKVYDGRRAARRAAQPA
jgi:hypothetical protein